MELKTFDYESKRQWIESGYKYVKLTNSADIGLSNSGTEAFVLLEPYLNTNEALESNSVVDINSGKIDDIIKNGSGRFYH